MKLTFNNFFLPKQQFVQIARGVAYAAAGFVIIISILMISNYFQLKSIDPLNSIALQSLMDKLQDNPDDQTLKNEIRALDLLSRKAHFTSVRQLRTGSYILLGAMIVLLIALKIINDLQRNLPAPPGHIDIDRTWLAALRSRKWLTVSGAVLLCLMLLSAALSYKELKTEKLFENTTTAPTPEELSTYWLNFRGPGANGIAQTKNAPIHWDGKSGAGIKWKIEVPRQGYSSPVIWRNRLFLTGADEKVQEVYCFNTANGELRWRKEVSAIPGSQGKLPQVHKDTKYAAPTVATDGSHVCAIFPTGDLICFDLEGNRLWAFNMGLPDNHYGHSSSLIIYQHILIVQYDQRSDSRLLGLDVATGNTIWQVPRSVISWSSPICVDTGKRMELILTNSRSVDSYDPLTGASLWSVDCLAGEVGPSAAYADGMVFVANDRAVVAGIRITDTGAEVVWENDDDLPDTASPLATANYVLIATSYGFIICLDAKTGDKLWEQEFNDGFYASPILVADRVYAMDLQGVLHIFNADKEYQAISDPQLGEASACTPAFVGDLMYLRGNKYLYCVTGE